MEKNWLKDKERKWTKRASKIKQKDVLAFIAVRVFGFFLIPGLVLLDSVSLTSDT